MAKKVVSVLISMILIFSLSASVFAETKSEIQQKKEEAQQKKEEAEKEKKQVTEKKEAVIDEIEELNVSINDNQDKLDDLSDELTTLSKDIDNLKKELEETQKKYTEQENLLKDRISAQYEAGETTFLDVLLNSSSFSDFLSNYFLVSEILENDSDLLTSIDNQKTKIEKDKQSLEDKQKDLKTKKAEQEKVRVLLNNQKVQKQNKVNSLSEEEKKLQEEIDNAKAQIRSAEKSLLNYVPKNNSNSNIKYTGGKLKWPSQASSNVTSWFGNRKSPGGGGSTDHKGIDIAAPKNSNILAADGGTVIKVNTSCEHNYPKSNAKDPCNALGKYIMIDHGNGLVTVYEHCSSIIVSVGQKVSAGQVIAYVGSTGNSTGYHLHFGTILNKQYVNPATYLGIL